MFHVFFYKQTPEPEFNEIEPRLKSSKNRFQLSASLNIEILNTNSAQIL